MNQKNIFMFIGAVLVLQGIAFYAMGSKIAASSFPNLDEAGNHAITIILSVVSMLSILVGLVSFAARNSPAVLWGFTLGFGLLTLNTLKHFFIDHINVPIPALIIQILITLLCAYLWLGNKKTAA